MDKNRIKQRVTITLPPELNARWNAVAKRHHLMKSSMIEEFLEMVLPALENEDTKTMIKNALKQNEDYLKDIEDVIKTM